jgi:hypothetical protein
VRFLCKTRRSSILVMIGTVILNGSFIRKA